MMNTTGIELGFGAPLPLVAQFGAVFKVPFDGIREASRKSTLDYFDLVAGPLETDIARDPETTSLDLTTFVRFADQSGLSTVISAYPDGAVGFSCSFIATNRKALVALIDAASAALTEMDSKVLSEGLHNS